ncbi:MAG: YncE family protein [Deltaproteobacteria bacterium]|jgi:DNA-binding beta-propeller fold protein YncE|nr:YncE family protein [Deltaproteobacteria bacterium]
MPAKSQPHRIATILSYLRFLTPFFLFSLALLSCAPKIASPDAMEAAPPTVQGEAAGAMIIPAGQLYAPRHGQRLQRGATVDGHVNSPKSVNFTKDGKKVYVNALEGMETLVYSFPELRLQSVIGHSFGTADAGLFKGGETTVFGYPYYHRRDSSAKNVFSGKPVEGAFSHDGRYFWVPYYRRSFDSNASGPSAMAIIDTGVDRIVRVMPTGPLPKMVAVSPDNSILAVTHWGDNTVGLIDISSSDPRDFSYTQLLVVERRLDTAGLTGNRDNNCGYCLRGTVFSPDGRHLLVGRMAGGGVSVFAIPGGEYLGSFTNFSPSPRHLVLDPAGEFLYASDSRHGVVARVSLAEALESLRANPGQSVGGPEGEKLDVGKMPRTIAISPDGLSLYASVYGSSKLVRVDTGKWQVSGQEDVSPFPVGLGVSPGGGYVAITSQGRLDSELDPPAYSGGNSVEIFKVN